MKKTVKHHHLLNKTKHSVLITMAATSFGVILIKALIRLYYLVYAELSHVLQYKGWSKG